MADRLPRVEFLPSVAPALEPALASHGWIVEDRLPLMTCSTRTARDLKPPEGVLVHPPSDDVVLLEMARLQHDVFGDPEPVDDRTVARLRGSLEPRRPRADRHRRRKSPGRRCSAVRCPRGRRDGDRRRGGRSIASTARARREHGGDAHPPGVRRRPHNRFFGSSPRSRRGIPQCRVQEDINQRPHVAGG